MAYSFEQFEKEHFLDKASELIQDEEVQPGLLDTVFTYLSLDKILTRLLGDEHEREQIGKKILSYFSISERLEGLSPDERLEGLSPDEIKAYIEKLEDEQSIPRNGMQDDDD